MQPPGSAASSEICRRPIRRVIPRPPVWPMKRPGKTGEKYGRAYSLLDTIRDCSAEWQRHGWTAPALAPKTFNPPVVAPPFEDNPFNGPIYPSYVPKVDSDGNDIAGIRLPELTVPLATYTGWGLRSGVWANDGCEASGQYIPFQTTKAQRIAADDPRPSVQERYPSFAMYRAAVMNAIDNLVKDRFMLCEDTQAVFARLLNAGLAAGVPALNGNPIPQDQVPSCKSNGKQG